MSTFNDIDITCDQCGDEFRGSVWAAIHAGEDPELKDLLLGGELNLVQCPSCGHVHYQEQFLLYQDPAAELIAYVHRESERAGVDELQKMMLRASREAQEVFPEKDRKNYEPVLLFGLESLIELIRDDEAREEQSDVAGAVCKEHQIATTVLRPSAARRRSLPRILPKVGEGHTATREEILEGLRQLLQINPTLSLYADLQTVIQADPGWTTPR